MSRTVLSSPFLVGFDAVERAIERVAKSGDGYPPYNIERLEPGSGEEARLRITVAVAGFSADELSVIVEKGHLVVRGARGAEDEDRVFLHRGIAARQFTRSFMLAEGWQADAARLGQGLLTIEVARLSVEDEVKRIAITVGE